MMRAVGASLAFLVKASDAAPVDDPSPCACPADPPHQARWAQDADGNVVRAPGSGCFPCGTGPFVREPTLLDHHCVASCPPDRPTIVNGTCTAANACPPATPFRQNGVCVAACCPIDPTCPVQQPLRKGAVCVALKECPVVHDTECADQCPVGQKPSADGYCVDSPQPREPQCAGAATDSSNICCLRSEVCFADADCCSNSCDRAEGICRGEKGDACSVGNDCASQLCRDGSCRKAGGETCDTDDDCFERCTSAHLCCIHDGATCTPGDDQACCSGVCLPSGSCSRLVN